jgi:hypothetical protein
MLVLPKQIPKRKYPARVCIQGLNALRITGPLRQGPALGGQWADGAEEMG